MNDQICPICSEGILHDFVELELFGSDRYTDDRKVLSPTWWSVCSACGSEQADRTQTAWNKKIMIEDREKFNYDLDKMKEAISASEKPDGKIKVPHFDNFDDFDKWINTL